MVAATLTPTSIVFYYHSVFTHHESPWTRPRLLKGAHPVGANSLHRYAGFIVGNKATNANGVSCVVTTCI
jgi:hypothetical protein